MTTKEFREKFFQLVEKAQHVVITAHMSPDDDSIASVLSIYEIVKTKYPDKDLKIIYSGERVDRWHMFTYFDQINFVDDLANYLSGVDLLIALDSSSGMSRFSKFPEKLEGIPERIVIDHHASTIGPFTLSLVNSESTSNAELIYHALIEGEPLSKSLAEAFLLGIVGDTGNFSYIPPSQSQVFILIKELVEKVGVRIDEFRARYGGIPKRILPLLQELVKNMDYTDSNDWPPGQYTYIDRAVMEQGGYSDEDMSAASHIYISQYVKKIQGYDWGFVITPRSDNGCRMSSRALPKSVNVRELHERMNIGSGHDLAAGGFFAQSDPKECITKVLEWMKEHTPRIG